MFDYDEDQSNKVTYKSEMEKQKNKMEKSLETLLVLVKSEDREEYLTAYEEEIAQLKGSIELRTKIIPLMDGNKVVNINKGVK